MIEILKKYGFDFKGSCSCDNHLTHKYKNKDVVVKIRIKKQVFKINKYGTTIITWQPLPQLEKVLKEVAGNREYSGSVEAHA